MSYPMKEAPTELPNCVECEGTPRRVYTPQVFKMKEE